MHSHATRAFMAYHPNQQVQSLLPSNTTRPTASTLVNMNTLIWKELERMPDLNLHPMNFCASV